MSSLFPDYFWAHWQWVMLPASVVTQQRVVIVCRAAGQRWTCKNQPLHVYAEIDGLPEPELCDKYAVCGWLSSFWNSVYFHLMNISHSLGIFVLIIISEPQSIIMTDCLRLVGLMEQMTKTLYSVVVCYNNMNREEVFTELSLITAHCVLLCEFYFADSAPAVHNMQHMFHQLGRWTENLN